MHYIFLRCQDAKMPLSTYKPIQFVNTSTLSGIICKKNTNKTTCNYKTSYKEDVPRFIENETKDELSICKFIEELRNIVWKLYTNLSTDPTAYYEERLIVGNIIIKNPTKMAKNFRNT